MATIWDVLGIEPTRDESEIRRAYARELKLRRPDKDPKGFQALREAFDSAKRYASSTVVLNDEDEHFPGKPEPTPMMDYVRELMQEQTSQPQTLWSKNELWEQAQSVSTLLIRDELEGLGTLHRYLDNEIPDALEARHVFSLMLAEALSEQKWLNRSLLNEVSAVMDWQIDSYRSSQLPDWLVHALEQQIAITNRENYWQYLARQYGGNRYAQLKWRLLTEKGMAIPGWVRLVPDLLSQLAKQVGELRQQSPALLERLNPSLLEVLQKPTLALSWGAIIAVVFWGYTAWLTGHESPKAAFQSGVMLAVVATFLWGYPFLERRFKSGGAASKCVHTVFWLASWLLLAMAFYSAWRGASAWQGKDVITMRALVILLFLVIPVGWALWQRRGDWRNLPVRIVVVVLMFPVLFIRQLPPLVNLLGMILLPMLYGITIEMVYFIK
ncbi:molecular chaperone DnaJ [Enterobacter sp. Ap-916]|uniref:molecular chaperone DnaJ n=1 Tax=Enterobacteriaceae TaxID=543 RepID=UPI00141DCDF9|nr:MULTISPECIES: molecular chaperone DnaJ [unclassified Enterobacter]NIF59438.1 molecular chaperone DnaJ [Enterobacter sp. Ap-867]NIG30836.1 molecular chaperone DnaJ [Enterobacter sp. Ap-916]